MESVLIVSNTPSTMRVISAFLSSEPLGRIVSSTNGAEARRTFLESEFDLVIIDSPLPDEEGSDLSIHVSESSAVIVITDEERLLDMAYTVEDSGVCAVPRNVEPDFFHQIVRLLMTSRRRVQKLEEENRRLQLKIEELRLVDRAKCVLIQVLKMSESQAHRYIEKQSMDLRLSKIAVAENVLRTYER